MSSFDPYADGIAIEIALSRDATTADIKVARELLDEWLEGYETDDQIRYRNCGLVGEAGASRLLLWADRVDDPDGGAGAKARAVAIGELAAARLPVAQLRVTDAAAAAGEDLVDRLGTPAMMVRPGGDLAGDWVSERPPSRSRRDLRLTIGVVALLVLVGGCLYLGWRGVVPPSVRHLPAEAAEVEYAAIDMFPDSDFYLQAELSEGICRRHVAEEYPELQQLDIREIAEQEQGWIGWGFGPRDDDGNPLSWWRAGELSSENTWVAGRPGSWAIVQCADGRFYLRSFTH